MAGFASSDSLSASPGPVGTDRELAIVLDGEPVILPVNHVLDQANVAFRTAPESKLFAAQGGSPVTSEVDSYESARRAV